MRAPISTSNPFLAIATFHKVDYAIVVLLAEWLAHGSPLCPPPDDPRHARQAWWFWMRQQLRNLPGAVSVQVQEDVVETVHRLVGSDRARSVA